MEAPNLDQVRAFIPLMLDRERYCIPFDHINCMYIPLSNSAKKKWKNEDSYLNLYMDHHLLIENICYTGCFQHIGGRYTNPSNPKSLVIQMFNMYMIDSVILNKFIAISHITQIQTNSSLKIT